MKLAQMMPKSLDLEGVRRRSYAIGRHVVESKFLAASAVWTMATRPSTPFLMSVWPATIHTRVFEEDQSRDDFEKT